MKKSYLFVPAALTLLLLFSFMGANQAQAYYFPPGNIPPGPPPNYSQVDTSYFLGAPDLPRVISDSGGFYVWVDNIGVWNIANRIYKLTAGAENYHGSVLASMSAPPTPGVNVFATNFEIYSDSSDSYCYKQNDRWGWYEWDTGLYEIWWDVSTRNTAGQNDSTDYMKIMILGCAIDFNLWSDDWNGEHFGPDYIFLGSSMTRLSDVPGFSDTYAGIMDPYEDPGHDGERNVSIFTRHPGTGESYNKFGLIVPGQTYRCDNVLKAEYGSTFAGAFAYEGNGVEFSASCIFEPCALDTPPVLQPPFSHDVFQCSPSQYCFDVDYLDSEANFHHFELLSGPGVINPQTGVICFTPGNSTCNYYFLVVGIDSCGLADTANYTVRLRINSPPDAVSPASFSQSACDLSPISIPGFTAGDVDGNLVSIILQGGVLHGDTAVFTPVEGANTLRLIATDGCAAADTAITIVTISLNHAPDAVSPPNQTVFACDLSQMTLPGFTASDIDGNLVSKILQGGTLHGDTAYFTPVVGPNTLRLIATDACGASDTAVTVITVNLNHRPDAVSPPSQAMLVCNLSQILMPGFTATDPDGNLVSKVLQGGTLHGDTAYFNPVQGPNTLRLIATDACGLADTSVTVVTITVNQPPVAVSPSNSGIFVCDLSQVCIPGFFASDPDNNLASVVVEGGTLHGDSACFTPVAGPNTLRLIATDACGAADTNITVVTISLNHAPVATSPSDTAMFVCNLAQICLPGFNATDSDDNLSTKVVVGGTLHGDTACFTPVAGLNSLILIATDACGAVDTNVTHVTIAVNAPPIAVSPNDTSFVVPGFAPICLRGFTGSDPDNNLVSTIVLGGTLSGDTVCFTPVQGINTLTLICTDACGAADTSVTHVTVNVQISLTISGIVPAFTEEIADSISISVSGGNPGTLAFATHFGGHSGSPARFAASFSASIFKTVLTFDYLGEFSSAQSPFGYQVIASDGYSADTLDLSLTVNDNNRTPNITSINDTTINVGSTLSFTVTANDPDLDNTLTLSKSSGPGTFNSIPGPPPVTGNFSWSPGAGNIGSHQVIFAAADGRGGNDLDTVNITVIPSGIILSVVGGTPPVFTEEVPDSFIVTLGGYDPASVVFSTAFTGHAGFPTRYSASLDGGAIRIVSTFDFLGEFSNAYSPFGFRVIAHDSFSADTLDLALIVNDNNRIPEIIVGSNYTVMVDHELTFSVAGTDLDNDNTLVLSKISGPGNFPGATGPSPVSSTFSWTPTPGDLAGSPYTVKFVVNDGRGGTDTANVTITVFPDGVPIIQLVYSPNVFREGQLDSVIFVASDPDGDPMGGFGFRFLPPAPDSTFPGVLLRSSGDSAFILLTFDYLGPWSSDGSPFPVRFFAYSMRAMATVDTAALDVFLTVMNTNRKPNLIVTGPNTITAGDNLTLSLVATDPDVNDPLTLSGANLPAGSVLSDFGNGSGAFGWLTSPPDTGTYNFRFFVDDGQSQANSKDTVIWNLQVNPPDTTWPTDIGLELGCPEAVPGTNVLVPVYLHTPELYTGGMELLIGWDPTALTLLEALPTPRMNNGDEYFNVHMGDSGPGTARFVWLANINDGNYTPPMAPGHDVIMWLNFHVAPGEFLFGVVVPIEFVVHDYTDNTISDSTGYQLIWPLLSSGCVNITNPSYYGGDPNMNCQAYEVADAVLVARRLIEGYLVWHEDDYMPNGPDCSRHAPGNDPIQEASADLNANSFVDIADLVRFINILNGYTMPPKLDPASGLAVVSMPEQLSGSVDIRVNSGLEIGGALVKIAHHGVEIGGPVAARGMEVISQDTDGILSVLVYSMAGNRIPAGSQVLFTLPVTGDGSMTFAEVSLSDSYGRLLDIRSRLEAPLPVETSLGQNYPNPFNPSTTFRLSLAESGEVQLAIYDIAGRKVRTLLAKDLAAGYYDVTWDGRTDSGEPTSSGVYFARMRHLTVEKTIKMSLLK